MFRFLSLCVVFIFLSCGEESTGPSNSTGSSGNSNSGSSGSVSPSEPLTNNQTCVLNAERTQLACNEKTYKLVTIGSNLWFAENLNVGSAAQGKYCYDDKSSKCDIYGGLYKWNVAMALPDSCQNKECPDLLGSPIHKGICPVGWHISNSDDFSDLEEALGGDEAGMKMKAYSSEWPDWNDPNANDGNSSGFSALPAMHRFEDGSYSNVVAVTTFWSPTEWNYSAFGQGLHQTTKDLSTDYSKKSYAQSVRCVMDKI